VPEDFFLATPTDALGIAHPPATGEVRLDAEMVSWYGCRAIRGLDYLAELARRVAEA
jgi:hypothetical protein